MEVKLCTEFFLACLYFVIIFIINFFLFKVLRSYLRNILKLQKIKTILKFYPDNEFFVKLYYCSSKDIRTLEELKIIKENDLKVIDTLLIGNIYKYLDLTNKETIKTSLLNQYYFKLMANQYLSFNFNVK